jgi:hypothetical protein
MVIYGQFTEGFGTSDLVRAKSLIRDLGSGPSVNLLRGTS